MAKNALKDESGTTAGSLAYWHAHRQELGNIQKARCGPGEPGHLEIEGTMGFMDLPGCTCGYGGEGPHGTAEILEDIGVSPEDAQALMQQAVFEVLIQCCRD